MVRTVREVALLLAALQGPNPADAARLPIPAGQPTDHTTFLKPNALKGQRLGVEKFHLNGPTKVAAPLKAAVAALKAQGATIVEVELNKLVDRLPPPHRAHGAGAGAAGGPVVCGRRLSGRLAAGAGLRLRAGHAPPRRPEVPAHDGAGNEKLASK